MKAIDGLSSPARQLCDYFTSTILLTTEVCGTIPRATIKTTNLMQWHGTICIVKVFLLSEREISPKYTGIFLYFVHGFGSYVKGLPKTKRCNSVAVTVSVRIRCICETALIHVAQVYMNKIFNGKIVNIFLPISFNICFLGAQKNCLIETVLLRTHNICFGCLVEKKDN